MKNSLLANWHIYCNVFINVHCPLLNKPFKNKKKSQLVSWWLLEKVNPKLFQILESAQQQVLVMIKETYVFFNVLIWSQNHEI